MRTIAKAEWLKEAKERFGADPDNWRFVCPCCGHVASVRDYREAGAPSNTVAFSCIGRWLPNPRDAFKEGKGPCNYAGGGLFRLNPVLVDGEEPGAFEFGAAAKEASDV